MLFTAEWTIFLATSSPTKCDRIISNLRRATGLSVEIEERKPYWKDPSKSVVKALTLIESPSFAQAIYDFMISTSWIASTWIIAAPGVAGPNYEATANLGSILILGVESAAFRLSEGTSQSPLVAATDANS